MSKNTKNINNKNKNISKNTTPKKKPKNNN